MIGQVHSRNQVEILRMHLEALVSGYLGSTAKIQQHIQKMVKIALNPESDSDEREMAIGTIADWLDAKSQSSQPALDLEEWEEIDTRESPEVRAAVADMDREEATFADALARIMDEKKMTQSELAREIGVGQPAIANMLARQCRPQRRTLPRIAEALGVRQEYLWPNISSRART